MGLIAGGHLRDGHPDQRTDTVEADTQPARTIPEFIELNHDELVRLARRLLPGRSEDQQDRIQAFYLVCLRYGYLKRWDPTKGRSYSTYVTDILVRYTQPRPPHGATMMPVYEALPENLADVRQRDEIELWDRIRNFQNFIAGSTGILGYTGMEARDRLFGVMQELKNRTVGRYSGQPSDCYKASLQDFKHSGE
jgi:hypothetical protein